ncbi:MAG: FAD-dependent pyridine nucleotide-disulfide oxidoreductase [Candidatus Nomurabacteria bacterium GW2011_GWA1_46_11]|uniref:FAD/NAD(P)-binding domain-containing protein n=2 Tax=Parcubacteria group TaxID=1794811 RepID=A0A1G1YXJ9_9BACT|nr:MAG: FAD-dependent pyridine nucleotide-disulfide oxidoreductase [Candidatus Nomurabacteria bacterium GW2011_GWA1_46_11]OGY56380.1 MAG: hypothetical protein A2119_02560 [Candidatus Colwellbacteria bacterium GWA2_46_10]
MENIVILGAGFGGLRAAMKLGRKTKWLTKRGYQVILIDKNPYHTYTPTLYEVATTSKETANYLDLKRVTTYPIAELLKGYNIQFRQDTVKNIDVRKGQIELEREGTLPYSQLIFALGAKINYFGIKGMEERCFTLKTLTDALAIRDAILDRIDTTKYDRDLNVVICGAGSTGVELTAELQEWFAELKKERGKCNIKTTLIDASPKILARLDGKVIRKAEKRLKKLGVNILTNSLVEKVAGDKITLKGDIRIRYDILIWTGGVEANPLTQTLPFRKTNSGVEVDKTLKAKLLNKRTKLKGEVYVIGDSAIFKDNRTRGSVPQLARPAISEGSIAASNIIKSIAGKTKKDFKPMDYPYIVPVGGKYAIVKLGPLVISGILGWILKGLIELNYLTSIMPPKRALKIWYAGLIMFMKNDRLG